MLTDAVVHTTGINWDSVIAITATVVVIMTAVIGMFAKLISGQITGSIDRFRIEVIQKLDRRITVLETLAKLYHGTTHGLIEEDKEE